MAAAQQGFAHTRGRDVEQQSKVRGNAKMAGMGITMAIAQY
jgi:hypothetical protein